MIEFVTLILGLVTGQHVITVAVAEPVTAVDLRLDDRAVARREGPPWTFPLDLGTELLPHRLEAVAYGTDGAELGRTRQLINFGRGSWEASIVLAPAAPGAARDGRVVWAAADRRPPTEIRVELDGQTLSVDRLGQFELPAHDPDQPHHLAAEAIFEGDRLATAEAIFGGIHGERLTSTLTAVPLRLEPGAELPPIPQLQDALRVRGQPAKVFSTETEAPSILVVRDDHVNEDLGILMRKKREKFYAAPGKFLTPDHRVTFVLTQELPQDPRGVFRTLWVPPEYYPGGLWNIIEQYYPRYSGPAPQHLWWSLVVAGERLSNSRRPRAVVLIASKRPRDHGALSFEQAERYLRAVRAPLYTWAPGAATWKSLGIEPGPRSYEGPEGMAALFLALQDELERQRIVWIEGDHLPAEIELTEDAVGLELVQ